MTFAKTAWVSNDAPDITADQLNRMEQGIADAHGGLNSPPLVTALPANPTDGQEIRYLADVLGEYGGPFIWICRYRAGSSSAYKWDVLDAMPLIQGFTNATHTPVVTTAFNLSAWIWTPGNLEGDWLVEATGNRFYANAGNIAAYVYILSTNGVGGTTGLATYAHSEGGYAALLQQWDDGPFAIRDIRRSVPKNGNIGLQASHNVANMTVEYRQVVLTAKPLRLG